ncbi:MAG: DUF2442 domain-containing protein [Chloroflexota bacterium]
MKELLNNRRPVSVDFTDNDVVVTLNDGSKVGNPLNWHHWLENATDEQRQKYEVYSSSIFWDDLDEGLDIEGMLRGIKPKQPRRIP